MATMSRDVLLQCDGFCVEGADGPIGWVEETWLGPSDEPAALALRLVDGRRGLLPVEDVDRVVPQRERVVMRAGARILELGAPHLVRDGAASWEVTGELVVVPPERPALPGQALLELRPWRLRPARTRDGEQSVARALAFLLSGIALLIALEIAAAFTVAYLVTGRAY
jgi:hypothetical protein